MVGLLRRGAGVDISTAVVDEYVSLGRVTGAVDRGTFL